MHRKRKFITMRNHFSFFIVPLLLLAGCTKDTFEAPPAEVPSTPAMTYVNLKDSAIQFGRLAYLDLDLDGTRDILFHTQLVGDHMNQQDKRQWLATTTLYTNLPVDAGENLPVMNIDDVVPVQDFSGYSWGNGGVVLAQQVIGMTGEPYWQGTWKQANRKYLPVQIVKGNLLFNGWVMLSFSTDSDKLILHSAAISQQPNKDVKAGH